MIVRVLLSTCSLNASFARLWQTRYTKDCQTCHFSCSLRSKQEPNNHHIWQERTVGMLFTWPAPEKLIIKGRPLE